MSQPDMMMPRAVVAVEGVAPLRALLGGARWRSSSTAASEPRTTFDEQDDQGNKKITDYTKYISNKSALRQPMVTRQITSMTFHAGKSMISLAEGMPNETIFPFDEITIKVKGGTVITLKDKELNTALQYIPSQGLPSFIDSLKSFQKIVHNPPEGIERDLIVTSGSQDGIYKSIELLVNKGDSILVPSPLYGGAEAIMKPYEPVFLEVEQDSEGIIPDSIRDVIRRSRKQNLKTPRVMYINPTGNNPTGTVIPNSRRQEIYDLACEYDIIILEDDPYHFMYFTDEVPKSFLSYDVEGRVLRFDSLSKVLSSGIRLGWVTGPKQLIDPIELHMQASYLHSSTLTQVISKKLMDEWGLEGLFSHFEDIRSFYRHKRDCLLGSMNRHLRGLAEWEVPQAGMFVWMRVNGVPDVYNMVFKKAIKKGITLIPGHAFNMSSTTPCPYIRLSYSKTTPEKMEEACIRIAELIKEEQNEYASFTPIQ